METEMLADGHMLPTRTYDPKADDTLAAAFATFSASADELQRSYSQWSAEVAVLRQHLQEKQRELAREREKTRHLRALAEVAAVLAHEVRNPVASMELFAALLADSERVQGEERDWVLQLQAGFRQLIGTVNNVLHFHSSATPQLVSLEVAPVVRRAVEFLRPLAQRSNVSVTFTEHLDSACVRGDEERLSQVLLNLATNSVRLMAGDGVLAIRAVAYENEVEISVRDSGPGIPAELHDKMYDVGFTTRAGSAGLGLAVCKRIVSEHQGTIRAVPGEPGAMFVIRLPRLKDEGHA
jgi:two-component system sensor histidine kinase FlrB